MRLDGKFCAVAVLVGCGMSAPGARASGAPLSAGEQGQIIRSVDQDEAQLADAALKIWGYAELGFKETRSSALLQDRLRTAGFTVKAGIAGEPTAFTASFKNGSGPVVAVLGEFDALPGLSQAAEPAKRSLGAVAGHGCGHNLFGAASAEAAIAVKEWMVRNRIAGELRFYGTPAEEGGSGKVYLVRDGLFNDVSVTLHWHPGNVNSASQGRTLANMSGKFRFHGISAHAAANPDKGRSALDAVEAMDVMVNMMREHIPEKTRIHYVITQGGKAPNVVPDFAEVYYYVRHPDPREVIRIMDWVKQAAQGAALGTQTKVDFELTGGVYSMLSNETLMKVMDRSLHRVGGISWTPEETAFGTQIQTTLTDKPALSSVGEIQPAAIVSDGAGASTDVSDVSWVTPTVGLSTATFVPGSPGHSWQNAAAAGSSIGIKGAVVAAKTLALTAAELFRSPATIKAAKEEFDRQRGPGFSYVPLVGDRAPPLDYRDSVSAGQ